MPTAQPLLTSTTYYFLCQCFTGTNGSGQASASRVRSFRTFPPVNWFIDGWHRMRSYVLLL